MRWRPQLCLQQSARFADEPLRAYGLMRERVSGTVTLHARGAAGPMSWSLDVRPADLVEGSTVGTPPRGRAVVRSRRGSLVAQSWIATARTATGSCGQRNHQSRDGVRAGISRNIVGSRSGSRGSSPRRRRSAECRSPLRVDGEVAMMDRRMLTRCAPASLNAGSRHVGRVSPFCSQSFS